MTAALTDLARRLADCERWRWMPGVAFILEPIPEHSADPPSFHRVTNIEGDLVATSVSALPYHISGMAECIPDLTDPATLGCLLALVREAHGDDTIYVECSVIGLQHTRVWRLLNSADYCGDYNDTEAEALAYDLLETP